MILLRWYDSTLRSFGNNSINVAEISPLCFASCGDGTTIIENMHTEGTYAIIELSTHD